GIARYLDARFSARRTARAAFSLSHADHTATAPDAPAVVALAAVPGAAGAQLRPHSVRDARSTSARRALVHLLQATGSGRQRGPDQHPHGPHSGPLSAAGDLSAGCDGAFQNGL